MTLFAFRFQLISDIVIDIISVRMSGKNVSLEDTTENPEHFIEAEETGNIPVISTRQEDQ